MQYTGDIATIQQRLAETTDLHRRRLAVLDLLGAKPGERIWKLDVERAPCCRLSP